MSLRDELAQLLAERAEQSPVWSNMPDPNGPNTKLEISGPLDETLQTVIDALIVYSDSLLLMVLRLADAVDGLTEQAVAQRAE